MIEKSLTENFLQVLGCSGGVGDGRLTTSLRLGGSLLIDAGTGLGSLSARDMAGIDHVVLTHSHQDHIALLPLLLERVYLIRRRPITLYGRAETLDALRQHIFNWQIYPDFSKLALFENKENFLIRYRELKEHEPVEIAGWRIHGVSMDHTVPVFAYVFEKAGIRFAFTGDTRSLTNLAGEKPLTRLICEVSYPDALEELAQISGHMTPAMLKRDIARFSHLPRLWISHFKPNYAEELRRALASLVAESGGAILESGKTYTLGV